MSDNEGSHDLFAIMNINRMGTLIKAINEIKVERFRLQLTDPSARSGGNSSDAAYITKMIKFYASFYN